MSFEMADSPLSFSIVINTYNRADYLEDAIRGVTQLDYPAYELIVVNGPSTDATSQVLAAWADRVKIRQCDVPNLSVSRNIGIEAAAGDIVAFLDDDAVPHPQWLTNLAKHYADHEVGGVGGFTVDNTGVQWQVCKTVCDRFGNAHSVDLFFDERQLNFPGTPYYPSLLGTNSSFRREALHAIGGFDHTFAYLLDETDVCLRLVDAGWQIVYEPDALVFHQFAQSHVRTTSRKPRTLYPSVVSVSYFASVHGRHDGRARLSDELSGYEERLFSANKWLAEHSEISSAHRSSLDLDVRNGMREGVARAHKALADGKVAGDMRIPEIPDAFLPLQPRPRLRVALVTQGYPPHNDAGIARWTSLVAHGLANLGVAVHVITRAKNVPWRRFENGFWVHALVNGGREEPEIARKYDLPSSEITAWMAAVQDEIAFLKTFGLDLVSFPIWDLEGLPLLDQTDLPTIMSLHTTYMLARPFKPEWNARVIYGRSAVDRIINAERTALGKAPLLLANSQTIIDQIEGEYDIQVRDRATIVVHGTPDLLAAAEISLEEKLAAAQSRTKLHILVPGRFELRKGYDLALQLAAALQVNPLVHFDFIGHDLDDTAISQALSDANINPATLTNAKFHGKISREQLDQMYLDADMVLMLSRFESFGLVAIEAMAAGCPVLALDAGALPEVIGDGSSGWLVQGGPDFIGQASTIIDRLAGDRAELKQASIKAYAEFQQKYSTEVMARDLLAVYDRVVAEKGRAR
ncbi:glycosyltransferase [Croceibacterium sp. TMG7-5b_MA50]|uniref:glycosyltransferase n=1 Tax=Croceibacterium sp. TMG7-5b_MA50 TaxID=3121290 RepID=UPI0032215E6C